MKKLNIIHSSIGLIGMLVTAQWASAGNINITVADNYAASGSWYRGSGIGNEDNETEPTTYSGAKWDLEAFLLNGRQLTMVGTYDFRNGAMAGNRLITSGDIFFDLNGDRSAGQKWNSGWDYVIHPNWLAGTYAVYQNIDPNGVRQVTDIQPTTNPWKYNPTASDQPVLTGTFLTGTTTGFLDWNRTSEPYWDGGANTHNTVGFDLGFLPGGSSFLAHFTMQCGNDVLRGSATVPEGGSTIAMFGLALAGLGILARQGRVKKN